MMKGLGGLGDMAKMMSKAKEMQEKMQEAQARIEELEATGESGAGLVKASVSAKGQLKSLSIDPSLFNPDDREAVEDLIVAAVRSAQEAGQELAAQEMAKATEGLPLPPGMKLPF
ncbi:YbaB/EbfC family nucleoid-associated protein [Rhodovulum sp. DZ06]|uniref:YbaB/EbfC family nucleoid-associated protein n=1 Tax=Rhodovulum sp. DZ06 TaxID=3425126 RepID=UPI003D34A3FD